MKSQIYNFEQQLTEETNILLGTNRNSISYNFLEEYLILNNEFEKNYSFKLNSINQNETYNQFLKLPLMNNSIILNKYNQLDIINNFSDKINSYSNLELLNPNSRDHNNHEVILDDISTDFLNSRSLSVDFSRKNGESSPITRQSLNHRKIVYDHRNLNIQKPLQNSSSNTEYLFKNILSDKNTTLQNHKTYPSISGTSAVKHLGTRLDSLLGFKRENSLKQNKQKKKGFSNRHGKSKRGSKYRGVSRNGNQLASNDHDPKKESLFRLL